MSECNQSPWWHHRIHCAGQLVLWLPPSVLHGEAAWPAHGSGVPSTVHPTVDSAGCAAAAAVTVHSAHPAVTERRPSQNVAWFPCGQCIVWLAWTCLLLCPSNLSWCSCFIIIDAKYGINLKLTTCSAVGSSSGGHMYTHAASMHLLWSHVQSCMHAVNMQFIMHMCTMPHC